MGNGFENLDPESRKILEQAMSMESSTMAMGMGMNQVRAAEQRQLAEDMERKNAEARRRRGAAIAGEEQAQSPESEFSKKSDFKQPPIRGRKKYAARTDGVPQVAPASKLPDDTGKGGQVDDSALRNVFAKISGRQEPEQPVSAAPVAMTESVGAVETAERPAGTAAETAPAKQGATHVVVTQDTVDRPFDMKDGENDFNAFTRMSRLPSKGLFYKQDLYGQSLKLIDNYILNDIVDEGADSRDAVNVILGRRVKGIMPEDILTIDETYILHWLRAASFTKHGMIHPGFVCEHCHFDTEGDPDFAEFRIGFRQLSFELGKDIDALYALHGEKGYYSGFLDDGRECHVYMHRLRHANMLNEYVREWQQANGMPMPGYVRSIVGLATIVEIEGIDNEDVYARMGAKVDYISELPIPMRETFEKLIVDGTTSCKIYSNVTCPRCGGVVKTPYPFRIPLYLSGL